MQEFGSLFLILFCMFIQSEQSCTRAQLLSDFLPDDACPLGAQFVEARGQVPTFDLNKVNPSGEQVLIFYIIYFS